MLDLVVLERWPGFVRQAETYGAADRWRAGITGTAMQPATRRALDNRSNPPYLKPSLVVTLAIGNAPELSICGSLPRPGVTCSPRGGPAPNDLRTEVPGGAQPCPGAPPLREADEHFCRTLYRLLMWC
jgi:hypothetical protein